MNTHFARYSVLTLLALSSIGNTLFADCPLDTVPLSPIRDWEKNVDALIDEAKKLSGSVTQCTKPEGYPSHLDVAIPAHSVVNLLGRMRAVGQNISALISETKFYFNNSGMILPAEQNHQNSILAIQKKIELAAVYIGTRCTQGYTFKTDVSLQGSKYKTTGFEVEQVMKDLSSQNTEVLKFYRNLVRNVGSEEYRDDELFTIAPEGFTKAMKEFYSSENLQKCHDADPKNIKIKDALKKGLSIGWKYPQAIKIWKDAFALLLYRSGSLVGATGTDAVKEAQIKNIVQAQKGGIGNSRFLINSQFFKEFGRRGGNQTVLEQVKETGKRIAYELYGPIFRRQVMEDVARSSSSTASANLVKYAEVNKDAKELQTVDRANYDNYGYRKIFVGQNKEQDPRTVTGLFQALDELEKAEPIIKENVDLACNDVLNKQATNISHPSCTDFMKG